MFVFKKNSYVAMLIAKYAFRDCLLSLVCLVVISVSFAGCGCLFGSFTGVCRAARLLAFLLCTGLLYNGWNGLLKWTRKSLCDVMPRHLFTAGVKCRTFCCVSCCFLFDSVYCR